MPRLMIICKKYGQIGNRLHTFANCIALAREKNYKVLNLCFREYQKYFESIKNKPFTWWPKKASFTKANFISRKINDFLYRLLFSEKWCGTGG